MIPAIFCTLIAFGYILQAPEGLRLPSMTANIISPDAMTADLIFASYDFDGVTLTEALKKTFENRNHNFTIEQFEQMLEFDSDDAMQKKWKSFIKCRTKG